VFERLFEDYRMSGWVRNRTFKEIL
jgi:hypothetical protein